MKYLALSIILVLAITALAACQKQAPTTPPDDTADDTMAAQPDTATGSADIGADLNQTAALTDDEATDTEFSDAEDTFSDW
ncbi:MAG: hypothetical protein ABIH41_03095, partial [Nanoarchaeota archaeon]